MLLTRDLANETPAMNVPYRMRVDLDRASIPSEVTNENDLVFMSALSDSIRSVRR